MHAHMPTRTLSLQHTLFLTHETCQVNSYKKKEIWKCLNKHKRKQNSETKRET